MRRMYGPQSMSRLALISASDANALALAANVPCGIIQWLAPEKRSCRIGLTTVDPARIVMVAVDGRPESWKTLSDRGSCVAWTRGQRDERERRGQDRIR